MEENVHSGQFHLVSHSFGEKNNNSKNTFPWNYNGFKTIVFNAVLNETGYF